MDPILSIVIPCFNSGKYLPEALESIRAYPNKEIYEVIIVNDGSTDKKTLLLLSELQNEGFIVIHQENKGPAAARNSGVSFSKGKYILFLDSDNKIRATYIDRSIEILNAQNEVSIVYGNASFFGDTSEPRFVPQEFDLYRILAKNYIDTCTVIRKKTFEKLGGFDENRVLIGYEDWELWIRAGSAGYKFFYLQEVVFDYRNLGNSLIKQAINPERRQNVLRYIYTKHIDLFIQHYKFLCGEFSSYQYDKQKPLRSFAKYTWKKYIQR